MKKSAPVIVTGHQPTYLPWLGLFHKLALADVFIFMDDVQYLVGDWNNRNKIRTPQGWLWLTVPVKSKQSESMLLRDIVIDDSTLGTKQDWQVKHWKSLENSYHNTPYFDRYAGFFHALYLERRWEKLVELNEYQLHYFLETLDIKVDFHRASDLGFSKKKTELVLEHCQYFDADICVTGCNGRHYIDRELFAQAGVALYHQDYQHPIYKQKDDRFLPYMSVLDLLFNHGAAAKDIIMADNINKAQILKQFENKVATK